MLLPTGMTLLWGLLGLLRRSRALCWAGLAVRWLASPALVGGMARRAAEGWQRRGPMDALASSQAIVVLSGRLVEPSEAIFPGFTRMAACLGVLSCNRACNAL